MKVKEGIVYNKSSGEIIGYVNLGEVTNQLLEFERKCASELNDDHYFPPIDKYISCFMVRIIFQHVNFPYAQFATTGTSLDEIFPLVWEAIKHLKLIGLKVLFLTSDGASLNCKFYNLHRNKSRELVYKTPNIFSSFIYFFVDAPHLLKTLQVHLVMDTKEHYGLV